MILSIEMTWRFIIKHHPWLMSNDRKKREESWQSIDDDVHSQCEMSFCVAIQTVDVSHISACFSRNN